MITPRRCHWSKLYILWNMRKAGARLRQQTAQRPFHYSHLWTRYEAGHALVTIRNNF